MEHTHTIKYYPDGLEMHDLSDCVVCREQRKKDEELEAQRIERQFLNRTELTCDTCNKLMGYVYENDLNGSRFYCLDCGKK